MSAARVARMLIDRGYLRVRPLAGGLDAWVEAGYTIAMIEREAGDPAQGGSPY